VSGLGPGGGKSDVQGRRAKLALDWERLVAELKVKGAKAGDMEPLVEAMVQMGIDRERAQRDVLRGFRDAGII
jgi:hypothetical protein